MARESISFPHPVLGNRDDVAGKLEILESSSFALESETVRVSLDIRLEHDDLRTMLGSGAARAIVTVDCQRTAYRRGFFVTPKPHADGWLRLEIEIGRGDIADKVTFIVELIAADNLPGYISDSFHSDYEGYTFQIDRVQILAQSAETLIQVDQAWDPLNPPTSSFLRIDRAADEVVRKIHVAFDSNEIIVTVNGALFDSIEQLPAFIREKFAVSTVVMPALVHVLTQTIATQREDPDGAAEIEQLRWYLGIYSKLESLQALDADPVEQAYRILEAAPEGLSRQLSSLADQEDEN